MPRDLGPAALAVNARADMPVPTCLRWARRIDRADGDFFVTVLPITGAVGQNASMTNSPYLFPAAEHPLVQVNPRLKLREAVTGFGIALRYQERAPDAPDAAPPVWCETGHSIFILSGRIAYRFDDHTVEAGPGDMLHIPAGPAHRHQPRVIGEESVRYVLTEFPAPI